jgi:phospholipase/carboxylesterase
LTTTPQTESAPAPALRRQYIQTPGYFYVERGPEAVAPAPALVAIHGYGQTAPEFLAEARPFAPADFTLVAPQGINQIPSRRQRKITFSWMSSFEKPDSIKRNNEFLGSMIKSLASEKALQSGRVALMGFSQGSSVAYRLAERHPERIRALVSACADIPPDVEAQIDRLRGIAFLVLYGLKDPIIPNEKSMHAARVLREAGCDVTEIAFDGAHLLPLERAEEIRAWLHERTL